MRPPIEQLQNWLAGPESLRLESKEAKNRDDVDKLVQYCVALAHEGGGKNILGGDDHPWRTCGRCCRPCQAVPSSHS